MSSNSWRVAVAAAALAAYAVTLTARGWIRDDRWLIADNALFAPGWSAAAAVVTTGYVEAASGGSAPISEYRPLLSLSFLAQLATTGRRPAPLHAANVLLHAAVCLLLFEALRRRLSVDAAGAGALLFAVLPVHAEVVSYISSRGELLTAISTLACWLLLEGPRPRLFAGLACFAAGLLSKEHAVVIPAFLALADWTFEGERPWSPARRPVYAGLACVLAAYALLRLAVLGARQAAGAPFFASRLDAALAWPRFALAHYAWPAVSGVGLCSDFTGAGGARAVPFSIAGAAALAALAVAAARCLRGVARRKPWAFWTLGPLLFLLPSCPLLVPLDTIGAERFLYLPTIGLAAGFGALYARARARTRWAWLGLAAAVSWYAAALAVRNSCWLSDIAYYRAAAACNPSSAHARGGLGAALLEAGREAEGRRLLEEAIALDPRLPQPRYDLAVAAWRRGDEAETLRRAREAVALESGSTDALLLLALAEEKAGRLGEATALLRRAESLMPWSPLVQYNLGRVLLLEGRADEARVHARLYARLAPGDPDGARLNALLHE